MNESNEAIISLILKWTIPFFLGLSSTFIIDWIRNIKKQKKTKEFILIYLEETILSDLPEIEKTGNLLSGKIKKLSNEKFLQPAFESFNANVLNAIQPVEYYKIFGAKYIQLNEIITMIEYISNNLRSKISNDFYSIVNAHLKDKGLIGDLNHLENCSFCQLKKQEALVLIEARLNEVQVLRKKINELIEK